MPSPAGLYQRLADRERLRLAEKVAEGRTWPPSCMITREVLERRVAEFNAGQLVHFSGEDVREYVAAPSSKSSTGNGWRAYIASDDTVEWREAVYHPWIEDQGL